MNAIDSNNKTINDFLNSIEAYEAAYKPAAISYYAVRKGEKFVLSQGRLLLSAGDLALKYGHFKSENVRAGAFLLSDLGKSPKEFLQSLLAGKFLTPDEDYLFPASDAGGYNLYFQPFHSFGLQNQQRQKQLQISGTYRSNFNSTELDWELKAAETPFHGVSDLLQEFGVGMLEGQSINFEVSAMAVALMNLESKISGSTAKLSILLAQGLKRDLATIGYRVLEKQQVVKRGFITGTAISWSDIGSLQVGAVELAVSVGSVVDCVANYDGEAQHFRFFLDPSTAPNARRAAYQTFDKNTENLIELLNVQGKAQARDLECAIAWLLWMLGFSVTNPGGTKKTSDAADLIATTPRGYFGVIECTTGLLKEETKLSKLIERTTKVRQSLINSGHALAKVIPIMVTNLTKEEIKADLEQAHNLGVLVLTKDDFNELVNSTLVGTDPDALYAQAEAAIARNQNPQNPFKQQFK